MADEHDQSERKQAAAEVVGALLDGAAGVPIVGVAKIIVGPSPASRVDAVDTALALERAHQVPALQETINRLSDRIKALYEREDRGRTTVFATEIARLLDLGAIEAWELESSNDLHASVLESIRRSLEAVSDDAIPFLARLSAVKRGNPDRTFRSLARAVSDMSPEEARTLIALAKKLVACGPADRYVELRDLHLPPAEAQVNASLPLDTATDEGAIENRHCVQIEWRDIVDAHELNGVLMADVASVLSRYGAAGSSTGTSPMGYLDARIGADYARVLLEIGLLS